MSSPFDPFKVDFSNFYKFVSSVGLVLIAAAAALPWFVMKAAVPDTDPANPAATVVSEAVSARADQYLWMLTAYPYISGGLLLLGLFLTGYGLIAWKKRQKKQDDDEDEVFRQRRELGFTSEASEEEKEDKLDEEAEAADVELSKANSANRHAIQNSTAQTTTDGTEALRTYEDLQTRRKYQRDLIRHYESRVGAVLADGFRDTHTLEAGVRLPSSNSIIQSPILDFVARARDPKRWTSFAVEVRVMPKEIPVFINWLPRFMMNVAIGAREVPEGPVPRGTVGRPVLARSVTLSVIVVQPDAEIEGRRLWERFVDKSQAANSVLSRQVGLMLLTAEKLETATSAQFHDWVLELLQDPSSPFVDPVILNIMKRTSLAAPKESEAPIH